jgi:hypothetical protein
MIPSKLALRDENLLVSSVEWLSPHVKRTRGRAIFFPETGRFSKKNREAIKHEPRNH